MRALGTVAVKVGALILMPLHSSLEILLGLVDIDPDLGQVTDLKRCAMFFDQRFQINAVKFQIPVLNFYPLLRKVKGLVY